VKRLSILTFFILFGNIALPTQAYANAISYSINSPNLIASTFKVGGQLDFTFSVTTNDPRPEPVYCYIDGFINPFEAVLISGTKNNGEFSCKSLIPNKPSELRSSGTYPLDVLVVYFTEFGKQDLRQTFGYLSFAAPAPTPTLKPAASPKPTASKSSKILVTPTPVIKKILTIKCSKGKLTIKVTGLNPKCPPRYKKS
jgi:hypothetical protein